MRTVIVKIAHFYCSFAYKGGGGQKSEKFCVRTMCMTPKEKANDKNIYVTRTKLRLWGQGFMREIRNI